MTVRVERFFAPKLRGRRFINHCIPVELFKDLSVLESMIFEISKQKYLNDNTDRQRVPPRYGHNISLSLSAVEEGSAIPVLMVEFENQTTHPFELTYFTQAKEAIIGAVHAASTGSDITDHLDQRFLRYFERLGRSLEDGESIDFNPDSDGAKAILDRQSRDVLVEASIVVESTEEMTLRGKVVEFDQENMTCQICLASGQRLFAPVLDRHFSKIMEAFRMMKENIKVSVNGLVEVDKNKNLKQFVEVGDVLILEANDVTFRLDELSELKGGWHDGDGVELNKSDLKSIAVLFSEYYGEHLSDPYIYPMLDGGVVAEWSVGGSIDLSLEINIKDKTAIFEQVDLEGENDAREELDLSISQSWDTINEKVSQLLAQGV